MKKKIKMAKVSRKPAKKVVKNKIMKKKNALPGCVRAMLPGQKIFLSMPIKADLKNLSILRDAAEEHGPQNGLTPKQTNRLKLCIDEAFTNIYRHSFQGKGKSNYVEVEMSVGPKWFEVCMRDEGRPFKLDPGTISWPDLEKYIELEKKGGLGLFVLKKFTDYLEIDHEKGINRLVMRYRLVK